MMYLQKSFTVPAAPKKITASEACVYGRGLHEWWCPVGMRPWDLEKILKKSHSRPNPNKNPVETRKFA
jgi:hypothetical protein